VIENAGCQIAVLLRFYDFLEKGIYYLFCKESTTLRIYVRQISIAKKLGWIWRKLN
jgi:hypothetical protein